MSVATHLLKSIEANTLCRFLATEDPTPIIRAASFAEYVSGSSNKYIGAFAVESMSQTKRSLSVITVFGAREHLVKNLGGMTGQYVENPLWFAQKFLPSLSETPAASIKIGKALTVSTDRGGANGEATYGFDVVWRKANDSINTYIRAKVGGGYKRSKHSEAIGLSGIFKNLEVRLDKDHWPRWELVGPTIPYPVTTIQIAKQAQISSHDPASMFSGARRRFFHKP